MIPSCSLHVQRGRNFQMWETSLEDNSGDNDQEIPGKGGASCKYSNKL